MTILIVASGTPVIMYFLPVMRKPLPSCWATVLSSDGSEPAPSLTVSVIENTERISPRTSGANQRAFVQAWRWH